MVRPTYITGDFRRSKFFKDESRLVLGIYRSNLTEKYSEENRLADLITLALENGIRAFDFDHELASSFKIAFRNIVEKPSFLSTEIEIDEYILTKHSSFFKDHLSNLLESLGLEQLDLVFLNYGNYNDLLTQDNIRREILKLQEEGLVKMIGITNSKRAISKSEVDNKGFTAFKGSGKLNACNLDAMNYDVPIVKSAGMAYYNTSILHNDLLGTMLEQYSRERPDTELISNRDVNIAVMATRIASRYGIDLASLATRYSLSINEADRVVIDLRNTKQLENVAESIFNGVLSEEIFNEVTENIYAGNK